MVTRTLHVRITRMIFPSDGGSILSAGLVADLDVDLLARLPRDSYEVLPQEPQTPNQAQGYKDRMMRSGRNKK